MLLGGFRVASAKCAVLSSLPCGLVVIEGCSSWPGFGLRVLWGRAERAPSFQNIIMSVTEFACPEYLSEVFSTSSQRGRRQELLWRDGHSGFGCIYNSPLSRNQPQKLELKPILGMNKFKRGDFRDPTSAMWAARLLQIWNQKLRSRGHLPLVRHYTEVHNPKSLQLLFLLL